MFRKIKGSLAIISIIFIFIVAMGMVSASNNDTLATDSSLEGAVHANESYGKHFEDVQNQINNAKDGDEVNLSGVVYTPLNRDDDTYKQITLKKSINISGVGGKTIFNAHGLWGIFLVKNINHAVFKNITFTGSISGSAVSVVDSNADFIDCVFDSNQGSVGSGLQVYSNNRDMTVNIINCTFKNNGAGLDYAGVGGGIALGHYDHTLTTNIKNSYFFNNIALRGAGIYISGSDERKGYLNIDNTTFEENRIQYQEVEFIEISGCDIGFWGYYKYDTKISNSRFIDSYDEENNYTLTLLLASDNNLVNNTFLNSRLAFEKTDAIIKDCSFQNSSLEFFFDGFESYLYEPTPAPKSENLNYDINNCNFSDSFIVVGQGAIRNSNFDGTSIYKNSQKGLKLENCIFAKRSLITAFSNINVLNSQFLDNSVIKLDALSLKADISKISKVTYNSGKKITIKLMDAVTGEMVSGVKVKIADSKAKKTYYVTSDKNGRAYFVLDTRLALGSHNLEFSCDDSRYTLTKSKQSITVSKAKTTITAPKVTGKFKKSKYFKVTVKDKTTKKVVKDIKVKIKVGKKTFNVKTNSKGVAQINTKSLAIGTHNVVISSGDSGYLMSSKSTIVIKR